MDILDWIDENLGPVEGTSAFALYDGMPSQAAFSLPDVHVPFDAARRAHWADRGAAFDFLATAGRGHLLDLGPGDGWPSLLVAPFATAIDGVDASAHLVPIQRENAARLGRENVRFHRVEAGAPLPFPSGLFDGAMAASSLEQTPDPRATLEEIHRVLRPGATLRVHYEAIGRYRGGRERQIWLLEVDARTTFVFLAAFEPDRERGRHVRLRVARPVSDLRRRLERKPGVIDVGRLDVATLTTLGSAIEDVRTCRLRYPCGATWLRWMSEVGFSEVRPTHSGGSFAARLYDRIDASRRPPDRAGVDALLVDTVPVATGLEAPIERDPPLSATK